jgi:iron complex outermembrane receptor protein
MSTLRVQPHADLRFELLADVSDQKPERYFGTPVIDGNIVHSLRRSNYNAADSVIGIRDQRLRGRAQWQVNDWLTVRNEAYRFKADRHWKNIEGYRYQPATGTVDRFDYLEIGHDLVQTGNRLESSIDAGAHKLVLGWEVSRAKFSYEGNSPYRGDPAISAPSVPAFGFDRGIWASLDPTLNVFRTKATTHDFYVEDAWTLGDRWVLLGGLRRDITDMRRHELTGGTPFDKTLGGTAWRCQHQRLRPDLARPRPRHQHPDAEPGQPRLQADHRAPDRNRHQAAVRARRG